MAEPKITIEFPEGSDHIVAIGVYNVVLMYNIYTAEQEDLEDLYRLMGAARNILRRSVALNQKAEKTS